MLVTKTSQSAVDPEQCALSAGDRRRRQGWCYELSMPMTTGAVYMQLCSRFVEEQEASAREGFPQDTTNSKWNCKLV